MIDPFKEIHEQCNRWHPQEKLDRLPDFPRMIDVELTNACNFRCKMCPTGNGGLTREVGMMTRDTFDNLVLQCEPHGTAIRFIGWGEPTSHPDLISFVEWATDNGLLTHINTNGSFLQRENTLGLIDAGLKSIKFSFQGVNRGGYEEMRGTDYFNQLYDVIELFKILRVDGDTPFISASTTTTDETEAEIKGFKILFEEVADKVSVGKTIWDFMGDETKPRDIAKLHPDPCPEVFDKLTVHWDGSVRVCCNDYNGITDLGNINDLSLEKSWHHPTIEEYRNRLAKKDYNAPLCETCYDYMSLSEGEKS